MERPQSHLRGVRRVGDVTKVCLLPHPNLQGPSPEAVTTIMGCIFFWSQSKQS